MFPTAAFRFEFLSSTMIYSWMNKCRPMSSFWMFLECHCDILRGGCLPNSESDVESPYRPPISCSGQFYSNFLSVLPPTTMHVKPLHHHKVSMFECQNLVVEGEVSQWHQKYQVMSEYESIPGHSCWNSEVVVGSVLHRWVVSWKQYISRLSFNELLFAWILFVEFKDRLLYFRKC